MYPALFEPTTFCFSNSCVDSWANVLICWSICITIAPFLKKQNTLLQVPQRSSINTKSINISHNKRCFCINLFFIKRILGSNLWCLLYINCQKSTVKKMFSLKKFKQNLHYCKLLLWSSCKGTPTPFKSRNLNPVQKLLVTSLLTRHAFTLLLKQLKSYAF